MFQLFSNKIIYGFLLFFVFYLSFSQSQESPNYSITFLVNKVSDKSLSLSERLEFNKLLDTSNKKDSLTDFILSKYVYLYYKLDDSLNFQENANKYLKYTREKNDENAIAKTLEYKAAFYNRYYNVDSTFYYYQKSLKIYKKLKDSLGAGKILLNTAILQKNVRDYAGSELTSLNALDFLKSTNNKRRMASIYNNLGIIYSHLDDYDESIEFHKKALELRSQITDKPIYKIQSLNNIGKVYIDKKDNVKAIEYLTEALKNDSIINKNLKIKSAIISNLAYARFKEGIFNNVLNDFNSALSIQNNIGDKYGSTKSLLHLAEYYKSINSIEQAISYTEQAELLTQKIDRNQEYLDALELIAELYEGEPSKKKYKKYISIRDSLDLMTRKQKEVFASIQLKVEEKDQLIKKQEKSNQKKYYLIIGLSLLTLTVIIAYFLLRIKRKKQDEAFQIITEKLNESQRKFFNTKNPALDETNKLTFKKMLKEKYNISDIIIEFWQYQVQGFSEAQIAEKLKTVTKEGVRKRRSKLYKRLKEYYGHIDDLDKFSSVSIYRKNLIAFEKSIQNNTNPTSK